MPAGKSRITKKIGDAMKQLGKRIVAGMHEIYKREARDLSYMVEMQSEIQLERYLPRNDIDQLENFFARYPYHPLRSTFVYFETVDLEEREKAVNKLKQLLSEIKGKKKVTKNISYSRLGIGKSQVNPKKLRDIILKLDLWKSPLPNQVLTLVKLVRSPDQFKLDKELSQYLQRARTHKDKLFLLSALLNAAWIEHEIIPFKEDPNPNVWIKFPLEKIKIKFTSGGNAIIGVEKGNKNYWWHISDEVKHIKDPDDPSNVISPSKLDNFQYDDPYLDGLNALLLEHALKKED